MKANNGNLILKICFVLLQFLLLAIILYTLSSRTLFIWDEAIYSNNSLEMLLSGNIWEYTLNFEPNLYNTKPPLALWLQALSMKLFGPNLLALRLPTFIALLSLICFVGLFCKKEFNPLVGVVSSFIILTTPALVSPHVFLTADLDGLFVLFSTLLTVLTFSFTKNNNISNKQIAILALIFLLGFFVKSTAIFISLPSLLFILIRNSSLSILIQKRIFWLNATIVVFGIAAYYFVKEYYQPGTIDRVFFSEYERFYKNIMPWHTQGPFFYVKRIYDVLNPYYLFCTIVLLPFYMFNNKVKYKKIVLTLLGSIIIYLIVISFPHSKLDWYIAIIFPIWAVALAIVLVELYKLLSSQKRLSMTWIPQILFLCIFIYPIKEIIKHVERETEYFQPEEKEMAFLMNLSSDKRPKTIKIFSAYPADTSLYINHNHHNDVILFYQKMLKSKGLEINLNYDKNKFAVGDTVIAAQSHQVDSLKKYFVLKRIDSSEMAKLFTIIDMKPSDSISHIKKEE